MGGEIHLATRSSLPEKYRLVFDFSDESCLTVNFWWFGYAHYVKPDGLASHTMTAKLGPNAVDISPAGLLKMTRGQKAGVKAFFAQPEKYCRHRQRLYPRYPVHGEAALQRIEE